MLHNHSNEIGLDRLLPIYVVIFIGFVGYSLMITIFTPMIMYAHNDMVSSDSSLSHRTIVLGLLLTAYPLGQFFGSPVLGALSDRFGRKPTLIVSLSVTSVLYAIIATSLVIQNLTLLIAASLLAAVFVKLPLIVLAATSILAALVLKFYVHVGEGEEIRFK